MIEEIIDRKTHLRELSQVDYYEAIDYLMKNGINSTIVKFFLSLDSFSMTKREVLYLANAMRDSGRIIKYNQFVFEKHSTGGVGDPSSLVLIPIIAGLGYKIIKTTGKSMVYTNGSADRFKSIPNFTTALTDDEIKRELDETNACVLSHNNDICPADNLVYSIRENYDLGSNLNLIAASIACKKLASGAKMVLVDVKYGYASLIPSYSDAKRIASILKYVFKASKVKCVIVITNTRQTIGQGVGNAIETMDAIEVLRGKRSLIRDIATQFAVEMITSVNKNISRKDLVEMINSLIDSGEAYKKFLQILSFQGVDEKIVRQNRIFTPKKYVDFNAIKEGYVYDINPVALGEIVRRICKDNHDDNIGISINVKVGDYVKVGDNLVTFYYKEDKDLATYKQAILDCIHLTDLKVKKVKIVKRIIR